MVLPDTLLRFAAAISSCRRVDVPLLGMVDVLNVIDFGGCGGARSVRDSMIRSNLRFFESSAYEDIELPADKSSSLRYCATSG